MPQSLKSAGCDHAALVKRGERWLRRRGFGVVIRDEFRAITGNGEQPDVIGWRNGVSAVIECKVSRADFFKDAKKPFRQAPGSGMGDWRFYLCPAQLLREADMPPGWGLLWAYSKQIRSIHGVPPNTWWHSKMPFQGNKRVENQILASALRRLWFQGHFDEIYRPYWKINGAGGSPS